MRIGIMLRSFDENQGIGIYTRYLIENLLKIDQKNEYVFFYKNFKNIGKFASYKNVKELYVKGKNKFIWDQLLIPINCRKEKIDLIFHPKFTIPLIASCKKIFVLHGADWFIPEQAKYYNKLDVWYVKFMLPQYCKIADSIISVSEITTQNFNRILKLREGKIKTIYFGPSQIFQKVNDPAKIKTIKERHNLPDKFIFTLSKYGAGGGLRKNIDKIFKAFEIVNSFDPNIKLVIGGKNCNKYINELKLSKGNYINNIIFTGWLEQEDLPVVYSLAELYLYPSNAEAFPIPITEAMSCGTPIITSNANGLREIAGEAAYFVNQENPNEIAKAVLKVLNDKEIKKSLSQKGLERSKMFSWDKCAKETLELFENVLSTKN